MKFAFYKAKGSLLDGLIRLWMRGPYAHCEVILEELGNGNYLIASSVPGTGVRTTTQTLPADEWDIIEGPGDLAACKAWFAENDGKAYDYVGLFGFVLRPVTIEERGKYWCSEACMLSVGYKGAWREDPNSMYNVIQYAQLGAAAPGIGV